MILVIDKINLSTMALLKANNCSLAPFRGQYAVWITRRATRQDSGTILLPSGAYLKLVNCTDSVELVAL